MKSRESLSALPWSIIINWFRSDELVHTISLKVPLINLSSGDVSGSESNGEETVAFSQTDFSSALACCRVSARLRS